VALRVRAPATGAPEKPIGPPECQATAKILRQTLYDLAIPDASAIVLALEAPRNFALLAATMPALRATAPAEPHLGSAGAASLLQRIRPALIVTDNLDGDLANAARAAGIALASPGRETGELIIKAVPGDAAVARYPAGTALLLQTTGTTGEPKLVALSRANLAASVAGIIESLNLGPGDRTATLMPLTHIHGLVAVLHVSLSAGATVTPIVPRDPEVFWRSLASIRPTWLSLVPTLLQDLLETAPRRRPKALSALRLLRTSSSALPAELRRRAEDYFRVPVIEAYGMTEACHQIASGSPDEIHPGSVGRPSRGVQVAVLHPNGLEQRDGQAGEICVRGPSVISRFLWPAEANDSAFHGNWFRTGDIGRIDAKGIIWLTGRIKEQINRGGETLSPKDIEDVLLTHPAVGEAAVFPLPHPRLGEEVAALCSFRSGKTVDAAALIAFATERLAYAQVPKTVFFTHLLPRQAASGKISRMAIAAAYRDHPASDPAAAAHLGDSLWRDRLRLAFAEVLGLPDIDDNAAFFRLGGTSLHALRLVARLGSEYGVQLQPSALLTHPTVASLADAILTGILGMPRTASPGQVPDVHPVLEEGNAAAVIPGIDTPATIPASRVVSAIYLGERLRPNRHLPRGRSLLLMRLRDRIAYDRMADSFRQLLSGQEALHHQIGLDENGAVVFRPMPDQAWPHLEEMSLAADAAAVESRLTALPECARFIDASAQAPPVPIRAVLLRASCGTDFLLFLLHAAAADGYARALLPVLMSAALGGHQQPPHRPFAGLMAAVREYDRDQLAAPAGESWLHQDGTGEPRQRVEILEIPLAAAVWQRIEIVARTESLTPFAIAWTAFALLLGRIAGGPVPVWSPLQRRRDTADFATMGNATALTCFAPSADAGDFAAVARDAMGRFLEAAGTPGGELPADGVPTYCFEFEDEDLRLADVHSILALGGHILWSRDLPESVPDWDLRVAVRPPSGEEPSEREGPAKREEPSEREGPAKREGPTKRKDLAKREGPAKRAGREAASPGVLRLIVDPASFSRPRAESLLLAYANFLEAVLTEPHALPGALPVARSYDRPMEWPAAAPAVACALHADPRDMTELFAIAVDRWQNAAALKWRGGGMSFAEIAAASRGLTDTLRSNGAAAADVLAFRLTGEVYPADLCLFAVAQVAAFELGCALLPLGQQLPPAQAQGQIDAVGARFLIGVTAEVDCAPASPGRVMSGRQFTGLSSGDPTSAFTSIRLKFGGVPGAVLRIGDGPEPVGDGGIALLLTSSGTTGVPKTIRLSQPMLLGYVRAMAATGRLPPEPGLLGQNIGFDAIVTDVWMSWSYGRHVAILGTERRTPAALAEAIALGAKVMTLSPTVANAALNDAEDCFVGLDALLLIGEVFPPPLVRRLEQSTPGLRLLNGYGPAETAVLTTLAEVTSDSKPSVSIGRALPGYRVAIVDRLARPLPPHWPGELAIACPVPAVGYHDAAMTAARFVELPGEAPGPFFRSGDIGWVDEKGEVRFVGRDDRQIKAHGVRIELDGVEYCIAEVSGVADAGVVFLDDSSRQRLVAVVQPAANEPDSEALTARILAHCRAWLPRAAVPSAFIFAAAMPMGPTGKKSHAALRALVTQHVDKSGITARRPGAPPVPGSVEARLAGMWGDLLKSNGIAVAGAIGLEDDVFTLGATSLDALRIVERIERGFGQRFPDHQIHVRRTIGAQAALLRAARRPADAAIEVNARITLDLRLVRAAHGPGPSRGAVLGMPLLGGGSHYLGLIASGALQDYDIWAYSAGFRGNDLRKEDAWFDCARAIAAQLLVPDGLRPRALIGFSIGGFLAWFVDRCLVAAGWDATPIINFDGGALHTKDDGIRDRIAPYLPSGETVSGAASGAASGADGETVWGAAGAPMARMLLLQRGSIGAFARAIKPDVDWTAQCATIEVINCRTVGHLDFLRPEVVVATRDAIAAYIEAGSIHASGGQAHWVDVDTAGGTMFHLLAARQPPTAARLRAFVDDLPAGPIDPDLRLGLLFLVLTAGDAVLALAVAARLATERPDLRDAFYAQIAVLVELGREAEAVALATAWCGDREPDPDVLARATKKTPRPLDMRDTLDLFAGGDLRALDIAATFCAPPPR
jgi:acyl-CoA synthetase (AMP-forming)/AMP-acid ligase II/acyl carrier protein